MDVKNQENFEMVFQAINALVERLLMLILFKFVIELIEVRIKVESATP